MGIDHPVERAREGEGVGSSNVGAEESFLIGSS